jgi:hypothetical protein
MDVDSNFKTEFNEDMNILPQDQHTIKHWASTRTAPAQAISVVLSPGASSAENEPFIRFCDDIKALLPAVHIIREDNHVEMPGLLVGPHRNIAFQIIPSGKWLSIFFQALADTQVGEDRLPQATRDRLAQIKLPADLHLYVSHPCPHCPGVIGQLLPLALANPLLRLAVIDVALFPGPAQQQHVKAVPTLIMEDQFRRTGPIDPLEILDLALHRDPINLSATSLRQFLEAGQARKAAEMMSQRERVFPSLMALLTDKKWPIRLAAMVAVEHLVELDPVLTAEIVVPVWERFADCAPQVKGDLAYVLGIIPNDSAREKLRAIAEKDKDPEVREAAREALLGNGM